MSVETRLKKLEKEAGMSDQVPVVFISFENADGTVTYPDGTKEEMDECIRNGVDFHLVPVVFVNPEVTR